MLKRFLLALIATLSFQASAAEMVKEKAMDAPKGKAAFMGNCVSDLAKGNLMPGDPAFSAVYQGKVYLFCNAGEKAAFGKNGKAMIAKAKKKWKKLKDMKPEAGHEGHKHEMNEKGMWTCSHCGGSYDGPGKCKNDFCRMDLVRK